jgi:hypothetical protein
MGTLLYIITLVSALTLTGFSISTAYNSIYFYDVSKKKVFFKKHSKIIYHSTYKSKIFQLCSLILLLLSIIIPSFCINLLNSQIIM